MCSSVSKPYARSASSGAAAPSVLTAERPSDGLAVPLTASVKVLFQRYVWRARIAPQTIGGARRLEVS